MTWVLDHRELCLASGGPLLDSHWVLPVLSCRTGQGLDRAVDVYSPPSVGMCVSWAHGLGYHTCRVLVT